MEHDKILVGVLALLVLIVNIILDNVYGFKAFPIINPVFCYESISIGVCNSLWSIIEIGGIAAIFYVLLVKNINKKLP